MYTAAAEVVASASQDVGCVKMLMAQPMDGMARRLVDLLIGEHGEAQVHAATALGRAAQTQRDYVRKTLSKSTDAEESLALLTASNHPTLPDLAEELFRLVAPDAKGARKLRERALDRMFAKPWPSKQFKKHERELGWKVPSAEQRNADGMHLLEKRVFVEGEGEGTIRSFDPPSCGGVHENT